MNKTLSIGLIGALALLFFLPADAQKIETVKGVTVVSKGKKPVPPRGLTGKVVLTEELTIGPGENPDESFSEVGAFVVDQEGTVFALDIKDRDIKVFDKPGAFLRRIGKKGQGPGDLGTASGILMTDDHQILVVDASNRRLSFFKRTGEFVKSVSTADRMGLMGLILDPLGGFVGQEMGVAQTQGRMFFEVNKCDQELKPLCSIGKAEFPNPVPGSGVKMNPMEIMSVFQLDKEGRICFGRGPEYEIKVLDREGKHIRTIRKVYDRIKLTQADIDELLARTSAAAFGVDPKEVLSFPEYFAPFNQFLVDDRGRLYVRTYVKGKAKGEYACDVFDGEGRFIAQFFTKSSLLLIRGDKAYGLEENEDGYRVIKRYGLSWR